MTRLATAVAAAPTPDAQPTKAVRQQDVLKTVASVASTAQALTMPVPEGHAHPVSSTTVFVTVAAERQTPIARGKSTAWSRAAQPMRALAAMMKRGQPSSAETGLVRSRSKATATAVIAAAVRLTETASTQPRESTEDVPTPAASWTLATRAVPQTAPP